MSFVVTCFEMPSRCADCIFCKRENGSCIDSYDCKFQPHGSFLMKYQEIVRSRRLDCPLKPVSDWVSADILPESNKEVLAQDNTGTIFIAHYSERCSEWVAWDRPYEFQVVAWHLLPERYVCGNKQANPN